MNTAIHHYQSGMGGAADTAVQWGTMGASAVVPAVVGPSVATALGIATSVAIPLVGLGIAAISIAIEAILHSGCGEACIVTSQWANQAEGYLKQNISQYFAMPAPRPRSVQQIAMGNFKAIWNTLVQQCSQPGLSTAGKNCIADRQDGGCKWKATSQPYPNTPAVGACWNWWNGYYYPIATDPDVVDDSALSSSSSGSGILSSLTGGGSSTFLLIGLALLGGALVAEMAS